MKFSIIIFVIILSWVYAENDLQNVEIPDIDDIAIIKERCESRGGKGTYDKVKAAKTELQNCLKGLVDVEVLKNEVEEAKKTGSMDEVFGKYCNKRSKVKSCVASFTDTITPCLDDTEKNAMNLTLDVLRQLGKFICFRDGDRIAMFVAEGGVECLKNHVDGIQKCVNTTFKINTELNPNSLPTLLIDQKKCDDLNKLQTCVVEELEKCKDSIPAKIIDALFRFIKRSACANEKNRRSLHHISKRHLNLLALFNRYLPELRLEVVRCVLGYWIANQLLIEKLLRENPLLTTCITHFLKPEVPVRIFNCSPTSKNLNYVTRATECRKLEELTNCFKDEYNIGCKSDIEINAIKNGLVDAVMAPCKNQFN